MADAASVRITEVDSVGYETSIFDTFATFDIFELASADTALVADASSVRITDAGSIGYESSIFDTFATFDIFNRLD